MSTSAAQAHPDPDMDAVTLTPEEEDALVQRMAETDEDRRAGKLIPLDVFLAERGME